MCFQFYKITEQCYVQMNVYTVYSKVLFPCRLCLSTVFARLFICLLIIVSNNVFRRLFIYIQIVHIIVYMWMLNHWPFQFRKWYSISRLDAQTDFENLEKSGVSKSHLTVLLSNFKFFKPCSSIFCFWMSLMSLLLSSLTLIHQPPLLSIVSFCWILTQEFVSHYKPPLQGGDDLPGCFPGLPIPGSPGHVPPKHHQEASQACGDFILQSWLLLGDVKLPENTKGIHINVVILFRFVKQSARIFKWMEFRLPRFFLKLT